MNIDTLKMAANGEALTTVIGARVIVHTADFGRREGVVESIRDNIYLSVRLDMGGLYHAGTELERVSDNPFKFGDELLIEDRGQVVRVRVVGVALRGPKLWDLRLLDADAVRPVYRMVGRADEHGNLYIAATPAALPKVPRQRIGV